MGKAVGIRCVVRVALLLIPILVSTGCVLNFRENVDDTIVAEGRIGFVMAKWDTEFSAEQRFVPTHPSDGGAPNAGVVLDLDDISVPVNAGVNIGVKSRRLRFYVGSDLRFNNLTLTGMHRYLQGDEEDEIEEEIDDDPGIEVAGIIDVERQPVIGESYGYARLLAGNTTWIPYVGLEVAVNDRLRVALEGGLPRSKFVYEKGHYRFENLEPVSRDSWTSFGWRGGIRVSYLSDDGDGLRFIAVEYHREHYGAEFLGDDTDIDVGVFHVTLGVEF